MIEYERGYSIRYSYCEMVQRVTQTTQNKAKNHTDMVTDGIRNNQNSFLPIII